MSTFFQTTAIGGAAILSFFAAFAAAQDVRPLLDPTSFHFPARDGAVVTLHLFNNEVFPIDWDIGTFRWEQAEGGQDKLSASSDIEAEPRVLRLQAHSGADVSIRYKGHEVVNGEESYRLILTSSAISQSGINVTFTHSLPVFVGNDHAPAMVSTSLERSAPGKLTLTAVNHGAGHSFVKVIRIWGVTPSGATVFDMERAGWYLLGGKVATYIANVSATDCRSSAAFKAVVELKDGSREETSLKNSMTCTTDKEVRSEFEELGNVIAKPAPG